MKHLLLGTLILFSIFSCTSQVEYDDPYYYESAYTPIIMNRSDLEQSIKLADAREIKDFGKIYIKDSLLFVNEKYEGVHVINNSDPSNPKNLGFIVIPGNIDISILNDVIYADNAVDLVALRYTGDSIQVVDRNRNVFPELEAPQGEQFYYNYNVDRPENSVIVKWVLK